MSKRFEKATAFQIACMARMVASSVILTAVFIWVVVWPPKSFAVAMGIFGICVASWVVANIALWRKLRRVVSPTFLWKGAIQWIAVPG
ncbi:MAG: hypothetical protein ACT4QC_00305 [Planctomycetaceae bacterium]